MKQNLVPYFLVTQLLGAVIGCSRAETLADLKPNEISLNSENPSWENGISELVKERCASCHSARKGEFVPATTPFLDFNKEEELLSVRNRSIARIRDVNNPMPPRYADPLSQDEADVLLKYLEK